MTLDSLNSSWTPILNLMTRDSSCANCKPWVLSARTMLMHPRVRVASVSLNQRFSSVYDYKMCSNGWLYQMVELALHSRNGVPPKWLLCRPLRWNDLLHFRAVATHVANLITNETRQREGSETAARSAPCPRFGIAPYQKVCSRTQHLQYSSKRWRQGFGYSPLCQREPRCGQVQPSLQLLAEYYTGWTLSLKGKFWL